MSAATRRRPPRLTAWLLDRLATEPMRRHLVGDLEEEFGALANDIGAWRARRWYLWQAVRTVPALLRERVISRRRHGPTWSSAELRQAIRSLRRSPGFTAVAVLTLALGIGSNTIVYTFVHGMLVAPLPLQEPDRLVMIQRTDDAGSSASPWLSMPDLRDVADNVPSLRAAAAISPDAFIVEGAGEPQYLPGAEVTPDYFGVLQTPPLAGRLFRPDDDETDRVIIAEGLWSRAYGRDPGAVGSILELDGRPMEIVGVVPDGVGIIGDAELWTPLRTSGVGWRQSRGTDWVFGIASLQPGVTAATARAELHQLGLNLAQAYPDTNEGQSFTAESLLHYLTGDYRTLLLILMGAVALVLIIVCVNLAGLLLARGSARRREVATLIALGIGRGRLYGRLLTESLLLTLAGGALGLALAAYGVPLLRDQVPAGVPRVAQLGIGAPVLLFSVALCAGATLVFGLLPAWGATRTDVGGVLASRSPGGERLQVRLRGGLVAGQMALALVLLIGASLLLRSFAHIYSLDLGFRSDGVVTARLPLVDARFPSTVERTRHYESLLEAVRSAPGIEAAAMVNALPLRDAGPTFSFETPEPIAVDEQDRLAGFRAVLGDYFGVMGIDVLAGRGFSSDELAGVTPAVIVDRAFERAYFPEGALGKRVEAVDVLRPIVGVVASVPNTSPTAEPSPKMYVPLTASVRQTMAVVAKSSLAEAGALGALRDAIRAADEAQTIQSLLPMRSYRGRSLQQEKLVLGVLGGLGVVALFLAALGTYGILTYLVSQRTQEIGVRMALGASGASVRRLVLASGAKMVALGLAIGGLLAATGARFLASLLFQTPSLDPVSFTGAGLVLVAAASLAALLPALRATRISPVEALRSE